MKNYLHLASLFVMMISHACVGAIVHKLEASDAPALAVHGIVIDRHGVEGRVPAEFRIQFEPSAAAMIRIREPGGTPPKITVIHVRKGDKARVSVFLTEIDEVREVSFLFYNSPAPPDGPLPFAESVITVSLNAKNKKTPTKSMENGAHDKVTDQTTSSNDRLDSDSLAFPHTRGNSLDRESGSAEDSPSRNGGPPDVNRRSAPRQPPEDTPSAKSGSAPR